MSRCSNGPLELISQVTTYREHVECGDTSPLSDGETCLPVRAVRTTSGVVPQSMKIRVD